MRNNSFPDNLPNPNKWTNKQNFTRPNFSGPESSGSVEIGKRGERVWLFHGCNFHDIFKEAGLFCIIVSFNFVSK